MVVADMRGKPYKGRRTPTQAANIIEKMIHRMDKQLDRQPSRWPIAEERSALELALEVILNHAGYRSQINYLIATDRASGDGCTSCFFQ